MKTEVIWSVNLSEKFKHWDLDTVILGDGNLKDITFVNKILTDDLDEKGDFVPQIITSKAKNATVKEILAEVPDVRNNPFQAPTWPASGNHFAMAHSSAPRSDSDSDSDYPLGTLVSSL